MMQINEIYLYRTIDNFNYYLKNNDFKANTKEFKDFINVLSQYSLNYYNAIKNNEKMDISYLAKHDVNKDTILLNETVELLCKQKLFSDIHLSVDGYENNVIKNDVTYMYLIIYYFLTLKTMYITSSVNKYYSKNDINNVELLRQCIKAYRKKTNI